MTRVICTIPTVLTILFRGGSSHREDAGRHAEVRGQVGTDGSTNGLTHSNRDSFSQAAGTSPLASESHLLPQFAYAVAQKQEDEWSVEDVKDLNKLAVKVKVIVAVVVPR